MGLINLSIVASGGGLPSSAEKYGGREIYEKIRELNAHGFSPEGVRKSLEVSIGSANLTIHALFTAEREGYIQIDRGAGRDAWRTTIEFLRSRMTHSPP